MLNSESMETPSPFLILFSKHFFHLAVPELYSFLIYRQPSKHRVGQKVCSNFPITFYEKTQMKFLTNPIKCFSELCESFWQIN